MRLVAKQRGLHQAALVKTARALLVVALLCVSAASGFAEGKPGWLTNYKQAQDQAKNSKKLLLLDFTGSDWCGWCIKLEKEVFSQPQFKEYASKNLVLLELDFPRRKQLSASEQSQNESLAEQHGVQGFPTIVVLNSEGKKVGELGYTPGGASAFIAELEKLRKG
jgi:protein disulfide-isomerase